MSREEYSAFDVFAEFEDGRIGANALEGLLCGIVCRYLPGVDLGELADLVPDLLYVVATREVEAQTANGGIAQVLENLAPDWLQIASRGYDSLLRPDLAQGCLQLQDKSGAGEYSSLEEFAQLMAAQDVSQFSRLEEILVRAAEEGIATRSEQVIAAKGRILVALGPDRRGKRMARSEEKRIRSRVAEYLSSRGREGPT